MKRIIAILFLLGLFALYGCQETVPIYNNPGTSVPTESTEVIRTEPILQPPVLASDAAPRSYPADQSLLRLQSDFSIAEEGFYLYDFPQLTRYNEATGRYTLCCELEGCTHVDENCPAWLGDGRYHLRFAIREEMAFIVRGTQDLNGQMLDLEFYSQTTEDGQKQSFYSIPAREGRQILLGDVLIYGNTALLSYAEAESRSPTPPQTKTQHIIAIDLITGAWVQVLEYETDYFSTYDLWGMNETHLILAYHNGGRENSYGFCDNSHYPNYDYDEYARDMQRWVLLEYPIAENARWSAQVAAHEAETRLELFSYRSFYEGKLYYVANSYVKVYDLCTHKSTVLFFQPGIDHLLLADQKIFYHLVSGESYYYDLQTGQACAYASQFRIIYETDNSFIVDNKHDKKYLIPKEDFYRENDETAIVLNLY